MADINKIQEYIEHVSNFKNLQEEEAAYAFQIIMQGGATPAQIAAFLIGLKMKGETVEEITGAVKAVRIKAKKFSFIPKAIDVCGTGGDKKGTFNISTAVALVLASLDVKVVKHGNRSVTSRSGSADVLKYLGINIEADAKIMYDCVNRHNFGFLYAPNFHPAMRHAAPIRQGIKVRTIFNIIGPLANPAKPEYQLIGVYDKSLVEKIARVVQNLGIKKAWVVHAEDGMDELSTGSVNYVSEVNEEEVKSFEIDPQNLGIDMLKDQKLLRGGGPQFNADYIRNIFKGINFQAPDKETKKLRAFRRIVALNAAAALVICGKVKELDEGIILANKAMDNNLAFNLLGDLAEFTNKNYA